MAEDGRNQTIDDVPTGLSSEEIEEPRTEDASTESAATSDATLEASEPGEPSYKVGYKRPPEATQIKPGERRNPRGRPRGSANQKTVILRALNRKVAVPRGDKTSIVTYLEAITETFALKAVAGDAKAAGVVINLAARAGILGGRNDSTKNEGEPVVLAATEARPSDKLVESVDPKLLSSDEQIELSKIAERIDAGGEVTVLSGGDYARLQKILDKGRGKNVRPQVDENLKEAA